MSPLTDDQWDELARDFVERLAVHVPEWTNRRDADPGVTLMELFAFLAESLLLRSTGLPDRARTQLRFAVERLGQVEALPPSTAASLTRVRYFAGQLLTAAELQAEQDYVRAKQRRHNLLLHGSGTVSGLAVTVEPGGSDVNVSPGVGIGPDGEELVVPATLTALLPGTTGARFVTLHLVDREKDPGPTGEATRIEEVVGVDVVDDVPAGHLCVARIEHAGGGWRVDRDWKA